jgi:hypothetical protein
VVAVVAAEKAKVWMDKFKIKDAAGKELPVEFYTAWINAHNNKERLFVYSGEVYDTEPGTAKSAHVVPKADTPEEITARAAAVAVKKDFKNRREALIDGDVTIVQDNSLSCNHKSGFTWV